MKRGFNLLFGVSTLIAHNTGKVVDFEVKSAYCKMCEKQKQLLGPTQFEEWFADHKPECSANHEGSSGKMEVDAMVEMFRRSEETHNVQYAYYVRDGDAKTFSAIAKSNPYADTVVQKKECVGHVQKRMGTRLRNLRKPNVKDGNKEKITGRGKLTVKLIDKLTLYYGNAIRANCDSVDKMKSAILATYYHKISTDKKPQHTMCPPGKESWCSWQKAKAQRRRRLYKHKEALPEVVQKAIKPVYDALSSDDLLKRCLGGYTQNSNESLNAKVWKIAPKVSPGSLKLVKIASNIAVSTFNDGAQAYLRTLQQLRMKVGINAYNYCNDENASRLKHARIAAIEATKDARIARRRRQNVLNEAQKTKENVLYGPGIAE